ncbi:MAG: nucleotidyl transferase AbiEii/AbiGii toxin family protein, partial [Acidobacteriia bacterium]|nr:nucleotidyl transferase AbiEii/AbiGii toxin family protein [Terriglobia bacterium]
RLGLEEDSLVLFDSDHGETHYDHGCHFDHHGIYECTVRIPLGFRLPGKVAAGKRYREPCQMKDLAPTVYDLLGIKTNIKFDGRSLVPLMEGRERISEPEAYITECTWMRKHGWRTPEWKLIHALEPDFHFKPEVELYNLVSDPGENINLAEKEPVAWIVKGGFALQLRLGTRARTTKDIDVSTTNLWTREETTAHLRAVASFTLGDWFEFEAGEPAEAATGAPRQGLRFPIRCRLDGRQFENFHLDVGHGDPVLGPPDLLIAPDLLAFAEIAPAKVRCYPLTTQVAEKLHTYTRTYASGETSRARDLADILLAAS